MRVCQLHPVAFDQRNFLFMVCGNLVLQLGYLVGPQHASVVLDGLQLGRDLAYQLEILGVGSVGQMFVIDGNLVL